MASGCTACILCEPVCDFNLCLVHAIFLSTHFYYVVFVLFCFKLGNSVAKTKKMLKQAFGDDALGQTQTYNWFNSLKMAEYQLTMTNVLNDLQLAQHWIMLQKCVRVSVRIIGEQSTMLATLRDCHMGHASEFGRNQHEADCCKIRAKAADQQPEATSAGNQHGT